MLRGLSAANTSQTITIPAPGANLNNLITGISIRAINSTAVAVVGSAVITTVNTNIPVQWTFDNTFAAWTTRTIVEVSYQHPVKSTTYNTATTIVVPPLGTGVQSEIIVYYKTGR